MAARKYTTKDGSLIDNFNFPPGRVLARKYEVVRKLGEGWESEVYMIREIRTGIIRAAKVFFPQRNIDDKTSRLYARKLHKLHDCPILIQYYAEEVFTFRGVPVTALISEYVDGELLSDFLNRQKGKRISVFQGVHLLHALAKGIESVHKKKEYHGDIHSKNVMIRRFGLGFDLKLLDMYHWGEHPKRVNISDDVADIIRIFYDAIGGQKYYRSHGPAVKAICCGLKKSLIAKKFRNAGQLRDYLETMQWDKKPSS